MAEGVTVSHAPISRGLGPASPNFWTSYMRAYSMRNDNQILHGD